MPLAVSNRFRHRLRGALDLVARLRMIGSMKCTLAQSRGPAPKIWGSNDTPTCTSAHASAPPSPRTRSDHTGRACAFPSSCRRRQPAAARLAARCRGTCTGPRPDKHDERCTCRQLSPGKRSPVALEAIPDTKDAVGKIPPRPPAKRQPGPQRVRQTRPLRHAVCSACPIAGHGGSAPRRSGCHRKRNDEDC